MKSVMRATLLALSMVAGTAAAIAPESKPGAAAAAVEAKSMQSLGVGIRSLALLLDAGPTSFQPVWALERGGKMRLLKQLEAKGLIKITVKEKLPDGTSMGSGGVVNYIATPAGEAVIAALPQE
jgi:hypothetical protein